MGGKLFLGRQFMKVSEVDLGDSILGRTGDWVNSGALNPLKGPAITQLLQIVAGQECRPNVARALIFQEKRDIKLFM